MDTARILTELRGERDRISQAISALEVLERTSTPGGGKRLGRPPAQASGKGKRRRGLTAAGRKRLSEMMKKRWADRRKNAKPR
jgi:hypothetical protein